MCGGKVGDIFTRNGIQTMGEIQEIDVSDLKQMGLSLSTSEWIKNLSLGICHEEVKERNMPTTANAVKTFKKVHTFDQLENMINLVMYDLLIKIKESL